MIDLHCHILPALDDGPSDKETSIGMFRMATADGITAIVCTPHFRHDEGPLPGTILQAVADAEASLKEAGIEVKLFAGADILLTYEFVDAIENRSIPTINGSRYFLLELPKVMPPNLDRVIFAAGMKGFLPIITHPERNGFLLAHPGKAEELHRTGVLFQLTAMSLTGAFGNEISLFSRFLLKRGCVDFVASDAHDSAWRRPLLSGALKEVERLSGEKTVERIFFDNPSAVLVDKALA